MPRDLQQGRVTESNSGSGQNWVQPLGVAVVWTQESQCVTPSETGSGAAQGRSHQSAGFPVEPTVQSNDMATETKDGCGQFKRFSGANLDGKAYWQWKLWHLEENPSGEIFSEQETVEILAASWKDKRAEISCLEKSCRFNQANIVKKNSLWKWAM